LAYCDVTAPSSSLRWLEPVKVPGYVLAAMLIALPLAEVMLSAMPTHFGTMSWRFGIAGLLSRSLLLPVAGLVVAFGLSLAFGQPWVQRSISLASFIVSGLLIVLLVLFLLDAVQLRAEVRPDARAAFNYASLLAFVRLVSAIVAVTVIAGSSWRSSRNAFRGREATGRIPLLPMRSGKKERESLSAEAERR
jgi:hypothetical protein